MYKQLQTKSFRNRFRLNRIRFSETLSIMSIDRYTEKHFMEIFFVEYYLSHHLMGKVFFHCLHFDSWETVKSFSSHNIYHAQNLDIITAEWILCRNMSSTKELHFVRKTGDALNSFFVGTPRSASSFQTLKLGRSCSPKYFLNIANIMEIKNHFSALHRLSRNFCRWSRFFQELVSLLYWCLFLWSNP